MVLDRGRDDMEAFFPVGSRNTFDGPVIRFTPAGCEIDLFRKGSKCLCNLCTGRFNRFFCIPCNAIYGRRVPEVAGMVWNHCFQDFWTDIRGCGMVHVDNVLISHVISQVNCNRLEMIEPIVISIYSSHSQL